MIESESTTPSRVSARARLRDVLHPLVVMSITLVLANVAMATYKESNLDGRFNRFFLASPRFGVPAALREHDVAPLEGRPDDGWDGQFYYYAANDLLARADTADHIDAPAYRYQRIGLPLIAGTWAAATGHSWVSPRRYYRTSLWLVAGASAVLAYFLSRRGRSPYEALLWSLGAGTQVTILNGLPDAAADALLIFALVALFSERRNVYVVAMTFAALSREAYIVIPCAIAGVIGISTIATSARGSRGRIAAAREIGRRASIHVVPIAVFIAWQSFVRLRFGATPASQSNGILGSALGASVEMFRHHLDASNYFAAFAIPVYLGLLVVTATLIVRTIRDAWSSDPSDDVQSVRLGLGLAFMALVVLYVFFGRVVMMIWTGYFKAANVFLFVGPFFAATMSAPTSRLVNATWTVVGSYFGYAFLVYVATSPVGATNVSPRAVEWAVSQPACLAEGRSRVRPVAIEDSTPRTALGALFGNRTMLVDLEVTNTSSDPFSPYRGSGSVNIGYQWLHVDRTVAFDGARTPLARRLMPGETQRVRVSVSPPPEPGSYVLALGPVQEGCAWFHWLDRSNAFEIGFESN